MEFGKLILAFGITMAFSISTLTMIINNQDDQGDTIKFMKPFITNTTTTINDIDYDHDRDDDNDNDNDNDNDHDDDHGHDHDQMEANILGPSKRVSRFLADTQVNPRALIRCRRSIRVCAARGIKNAACCRRRCVDLLNDRNNCGRCRRRCKHTQDCCRGRCVYLAFDKRHCGACNVRCHRGDYCIYGFCNYA